MQGVCLWCIRSRVSEYESTADFLVIPKITINIPTRNLSTDNWKIPAELQLADPEFHEAKGIDVLLGSELFVEVLQDGRVDLAPELPTMLNTKIGWVWMGKCPQNNATVTCYSIVESAMDELFERFVSVGTVFTCDESSDMRFVGGAESLSDSDGRNLKFRK